MLAVVGTLLLVSYVQGSEARAQQDLQPMDVLVVDKQIPQGSTLDQLRGSVRLTSLPAASVPNGALKSLDGLDGKVTSADLVPGEPLLGVRLVDPTSLAAPGSVPVPSGMQEISVQLEAQRVVGGRIVAGDTVGVVALFSDDAAGGGSAQQIFHKVLVTSVQRATSAPAAGTSETASAEQANTQLPTGQLLVTFARTDADSARIAFAAEFGTLWLTKEPSTASETAPFTVRKAELFK
ncbi:Flp pilus assembly protein CpaB [Arthrobacter sp. HMWF013]|uniref:Flp pilus assembly protein CpaB n=1 Tax=Arthrobacter sp. HMWF013 TaxID=2056849 RepID=UPI000D363CB2|nr:Flp pilus assembly protein CpaB [Arthrobacter sp. HMWF013]PTT65875.1 Flp pilus assembly protein CpaB [Arthrobacter sp. HMWF013]